MNSWIVLENPHQTHICILVELAIHMRYICINFWKYVCILYVFCISDVVIVSIYVLCNSNSISISYMCIMYPDLVSIFRQSRSYLMDINGFNFFKRLMGLEKFLSFLQQRSSGNFGTFIFTFSLWQQGIFKLWEGASRIAHIFWSA